MFKCSRDRRQYTVLIIKTKELHYFSNLFRYRTLHVSDRFTVHHQDFSTVYTAIGICHAGYADCLLARSGWNSVHVSDRFTAHPQESSIANTAIGICHIGYADRRLARSGWKSMSKYCVHKTLPVFILL